MKHRVSRPLLVLSLLGVVMLPNSARAQKGHLGVICASDDDCAPGLVCSGLPGPAVCIQASQAGLPGSTPEKPSTQAPPGVFGGPFPADPNYAAKHPSPPDGGGPPKYVTVHQGVVLAGWLLMTPPSEKSGPTVDVTAPFSQWEPWPYTAYNTKHDCEEARRTECARRTDPFSQFYYPLSDPRTTCLGGLAGSGQGDGLRLRVVPHTWPVQSVQAILMTAVAVCTSVCLSSDDPRLKKN